MSFGLINAPATFQRPLGGVLGQYNWQACLIYLDNDVIYCTHLDKHVQNVDVILYALQQAEILLKLKKFEW